MMKKRLLFLLAAALLFCGGLQAAYKVNYKIIKKMTIEEKAHLLMGYGRLTAATNGDATVGATVGGLLPGAAGVSFPVTRFHVPAIVMTDGPAGVRISPTREGDSKTYYCTHFPIGTLLACTWNTDLVRQVGHAIGNEALEYGSDVQLAPAINIMRNPLCGRNFEYYSEDPVVAGNIAAAYIAGIQSNGIGVSLKHFAVNNQETNRQNTDARLSTRALREIYLKGFEIAVRKAQPWTVMSSYNYVNGVYASQSYDLLTTILRDEWGFKGLVMTDWYGGQDVVAQMNAGNDLLMPGRDAQYEALVEAMKSGKLSMDVVDRNVARMLRLIGQSRHAVGYKFSSNPDLKAHAAVTRQSATEGMVLLKNDYQTLPLAQGIHNVAVFGNTSYRFIAGGTGSGNVNRAYTISLLQGLDNAGYKTDATLQKAYEEYIPEAQKLVKKPTGKFAHFLPEPLPTEMTPSQDQVETCAQQNDIAIITLGRISGEFLDRSAADFELSTEERILLNRVCNAFHKQGKKVVVLLNVGGVIETASWKDLPDAILCAWQGGQEGGNSVADILSGKVSPSGRLTMTFPVRLKDVPSTANFPTQGEETVFGIDNQGKKSAGVKNVDYTNYEEDVYVGYRYFDSFGKDVSYPFGFGLSYTKFDYSNLQVVRGKDNNYQVSVDVKNVGTTAGKEVVQLYVSPAGSKTTNRPEHELKGFAKTGELKPGEVQHIVMTVAPADLASFDSEASAWKVLAGNYTFQIGASSRDIRLSQPVAVAAFEQAVHRVLEPVSQLNLLKR